MVEQEITAELMQRYRSVPVTAIASVIGNEGFPITEMTGVYNRRPGHRIVGRARTARYVPYRPDIRDETNHKEDSPEYHAMGAAGPGDVVVIETGRATWAAVGGDMVLLHLKLMNGEGLVTDGSVRDLSGILEYGYELWTGGTTLAGRRGLLVSLEAGGIISCGGMTIRPGDLIVGDDDGITCVPKQIAEMVLERVEHHEKIEARIKQMIIDEGAPPGRYYNEETFNRVEQEMKGPSG